VSALPGEISQMPNSPYRPTAETAVPHKNMAIYLGPAVALAMVPASVAVYLLASPEQLSRFVTREGGPVESASAILYFAAAGMLFWSWQGGARVSRLLVSSAFVTVLLGLRELEVNKRLTTDSVTKINYYLDSTISPGERLLAAVAVLLIVVGLIVYSVAYAPRFWSAVRAGSAAGISVLTALVLMPVTKIADRLPNRLQEAGVIELPESAKRLSGSLEEILELCLPMLIPIAVLQYWNATRQR
jgi:hypothetical protein